MHQHLSRVWFCRQGTLVPLLLAIMFSLSGSNAVKKFFTEYLNMKPSATIHIGLKECPILRHYVPRDFTNLQKLQCTR